MFVFHVCLKFVVDILFQIPWAVILISNRSTVDFQIIILVTSIANTFKWLHPSLAYNVFTNKLLKQPAVVPQAHLFYRCSCYVMMTYFKDIQQNILFHFWPKLTHAAVARSLCDSWASCNTFQILKCHADILIEQFLNSNIQGGPKKPDHF